MKVLFVSHTANFSKFNRPFMQWFKHHGWNVDYASGNEEAVIDVDRHFTISLARSPLSPHNVIAFFKLRRIIRRESYDIIHAHTPTGGVIARLAARSTRKRGTKVIYTAHGFHFFRGSSLLSWVLYYPIESLLSYITDDLITINTEDYQLAKRKLHAKRTHKVNGVGVDLTRFFPITPVEKQKLRHRHGYKPNEFILIYTAELNKNKNQLLLLKALADKKLANTRLILVGTGDYRELYQQYAIRTGVANRVDFLGYRYDVEELYQLSDVAVSASIREGLGLNLIEAMACGLPVVCSNNRGHRDTVVNNRNGWRYDLDNPQQFIDKIKNLEDNTSLLQEIGRNNAIDAKKYALPDAVKAMERIYNLPQ